MPGKCLKGCRRTVSGGEQRQAQHEGYHRGRQIEKSRPYLYVDFICERWKIRKIRW